MAALNMNEESINSFFSIIEDNNQNLKGETSILKSELERLYVQTKYEKLGLALNQILVAYNQVVGIEMKNKLLDFWKDSEASFSKFINNVQGGEEAEELCRTIEKKIEDLINISNTFEMISLDNSSETDISSENFIEAKEAISIFAGKIEDIQKECENTINRLAEENSMCSALLPLVNVFGTTSTSFSSSAGDVLDRLKEDYEEKLKHAEENAREEFINSTYNKDGSMKNGVAGGRETVSGALFADFLAPNIGSKSKKNSTVKSMENSKNKNKGNAVPEKVLNKFKDYARQFYSGIDDEKLYYEFSEYLYDALSMLDSKIRDEGSKLIGDMVKVITDFLYDFKDILGIREDNNYYEHFKVIAVNEMRDAYGEDSIKFVYNDAIQANTLIAFRIDYLLKDHNKNLKQAMVCERLIFLISEGCKLTYFKRKDAKTVELPDGYNEYTKKTARYIAAQLQKYGLIVDLEKEEKLIELEKYLKEHKSEIKKLYLNHSYENQFDEFLNNRMNDKEESVNNEKINVKRKVDTKYEVSDSIISKIKPLVKYTRGTRRVFEDKFEKQDEKNKDMYDSGINIISGITKIVSGFSWLSPPVSGTINGTVDILKSPIVYNILDKNIISRLVKDVEKAVKCKEEWHVLNHVRDCYLYSKFGENRKLKHFPPLFDLFSKKEYEGKDYENIEDAFIAAWIYINDVKNYKIMNSSENTVKSHAEKLTGSFLRLTKAGLMAQDVNEDKGDEIIDDLLPKVVACYYNVEPDLKMDLEKKEVYL